MRNRSILGIALAALLMCGVNGCREEAGDPVLQGPKVVTEVAVSPAAITVGKEMTMTLTVRNVGDETLDLQFADGQQTQYEIHGPDGLLAWLNLTYIQATTRLILAAGEERTHEVRVTVDPRGTSTELAWKDGVTEMPPGEYEVRAGLYHSGYEPAVGVFKILDKSGP